MTRWREFVEDDAGRGSAARLNMVIGVLVGSFAVVWLTDGMVQVTMEGQVGHVYDLLATSNFVDWVLINRTTNSVNQQIILDLTATNQPMRFYRGEVLR